MDYHVAKIGFRPLNWTHAVTTYLRMTLALSFLHYTWMAFLYRANKQLSNKLEKQGMDRFEMTETGDVSRVLGMIVTRDREKRTITIDQKDYMEDIVEHFGIKDCNPAFTPGAGPELSLNY